MAVKWTKVPGGEDVSITCDECGKPLTVANEYGMFCEDLCGIEDAKSAKKTAMDFLQNFLKGMGGGEEL